MCGITGYLDLKAEGAAGVMAETVGRMADTLAHRGPDDAGIWCDAAAGIALGYRRLAIIDTSKNGRQPMHSPCARYVICYNGEVYNFPALRQELEEKGHRFRGGSDTEVVLAAISEWGLEAAVHRFVGMFAFALWDRGKRRLHLVRDRLGIKPLYYLHLGDRLLFGSELKALRAHPAFAQGVDRDALALYLVRKWIPAPWSIYEGVRKLPPASILTLDASKAGADPAITTFWSMRQVAEAGLAEPLQAPPDEIADELDGLLRDAVRGRMIADVPLGVFLSGGIDSSTVTALMQAQSNRPVRTFTIGFHDQTYNEAADAKAVARHLGTDHTELYLGDDDLRAVLPRLPRIYDEPFADSSQIPTFLVSEMARRDVTVCLAGDGGDEMFGGYNRYLWGSRIAHGTGRLPAPVKAAMGGGLRLLSAAAWTSLFDRIGPFLPPRLRQRDAGGKLHKLADVLSSRDIGDFYGRIMTSWHGAGDVVHGGRAAADLIASADPWGREIDPRRQMMGLDAVSYLPDDLLAKVDRASMAASLEVRVPLIDHRVAAFAWRLPSALLFANGRGKDILRRVLYRYVPERLMERPKWGFQVPTNDWLRGPLKEWAEHLLDEARLRREEYLDPVPIRRLWQQHLSGSHDRQEQLWTVLMFQSWLEEQRG